MRCIELNRAQRALWAASGVLGDDVPFVIAQCLDIRGPVSVPVLVDTVDVVCSELGASTTRITLTEIGPRLAVDDAATPITELVDLRDAADPTAAARDWMADATASRLPLDGPLLQCAVLDLGADHRILYARAHHVLLDGYAAGLLMRHVAARYNATVGSSAVHRPPPAAQPVDVIAEHENRYASSARHIRDAEHWTAVCDDLPSPLVLGDHNAPATTQTLTVGHDLDADTVARLNGAAERGGTATAAVLIAATAVALGRLTDRTDVPLTLVTSARTTATLRAAAGTMSNLLPIGVHLTPRLRLAELLTTVSRTLSDSLRHQQYRYEDMDAAAVRPGETLPRVGPVINMMPSPPAMSLGAATADFRVLTTGPVSDVNVNVYPATADSLRIEVEVNARVHDAATASALLDGLVDAVDALSTAPADAVVDALPSAAPSTLSGPAPGTPATLADAYLRHRDSPRPAVIDTDGAARSYRELANWAAGIALQLSARAAPGDVVAVVADRSAATVAAAWAVAAAGMCVLPVDAALPPARRAAMLADGAPTVVLSAGSASVPDALDVRAVLPGDASELEPVPTPSDAPAYLLYTSGTTGAPKGVSVSHSGIGSLLAEIDASYHLVPASVVAHLASPGFDTAIVEMLAAAHSGATLAVVPPDIRGGPDLAAVLDERGVTHLLVTPAVLSTVPEAAVPSVTHLIVGGDVCPSSLMRRWAADRTVRCAYGPTETTCSVTMTGPLDPVSLGHSVALGAPMHGVRLHVLDRRLRPIPPGGVGELYVSGPAVAIGILHRPAATAARFVASLDRPGSRMYRTGDRVRLGATGELWFLGRGDAQVKVRGVRVEPAETDAAIGETGLVRASVTVARNDDNGMRLHSYVVAADADTDLPRRVREAVRGSLGAAQIPASVTVIDELPLTVNKKVDRSRLPVPSRSPGREPVAPSDDVERAAVTAFSRATGVGCVSVDDDFFDLAGDSLSATAAAAELSATFGVRIAVRDVFTAGTPRRLAQVVRAAEKVSSFAHRSTAGTPVPIAPAQRNVYPRRADVDHVVAFVVSTPLHVPTPAVASAMTTLVNNHPMLRSRTLDDEQFVVDAAPDPARWCVDTVDPADPDWARRYLHRGIDVAERYPFRIGVAHPTGGGTRIAVGFHHLAVDGHSLRLLLRGLLGTPVETSWTSASFVEYAAEMNQRSTLRRDADIDYFARTAAAVPRLQLSASAPSSTDRAGGRTQQSFDPSVWKAVTEESRRLRVSDLTVLRSAVAAWLSARTGERTVAVGALVSGRDDARWADTVGMFVNTVAVTCAVQATRDATVRAVHAAENEAFAHATTAFVDVADALAPADGSHPLFQVMLTVDDDFASDAGAQITPFPVDVAPCDLHFSVTPPTDSRAGRLEILYATALFDETEVDAIAAEVLDSIASVRPGTASAIPRH